MKRFNLLNFFFLFSLFSLVFAPAAKGLADEGAPESIPLEETESSRADAAANGPNQGRCQGLESYHQQQCCQRAEKLKDLQEQEFALTNDGSDLSLFELQKMHDAQLAELKIQEGVLALQKDYFDYMKRLENPESQGPGLTQLNALKRLESDSRGAIDKAYKMQFIHDAMKELKDANGPFVNEKGELAAAESLYQHAAQNCQKTTRTQGICALLNPKSEFNQDQSKTGQVDSSDIKKMMQNYLMAYGVSTENLNNVERFERHAEYEKSLQKIPASVLRQQIESYEESQHNLNQVFSKKDNEDLGRLYNCVTQIRYLSSESDCGSNIGQDNLRETVRKMAQEVSSQANEILEAGLGQDLGPRQKNTINESIRAHAAAELAPMADSQGPSSITQTEKDTFKDVFSSVEKKLQFASRVSEQRAAQTQEDFFSEFQESSNQLPKIQSALMQQLCRTNIQEYSSSGILKCLQESRETEKRDTEQNISSIRNKLQRTQKQIDQITSSPPYQRLNSFKNYYAHQTKNECSTKNQAESLITYSGQCHPGGTDDESPVTQLLDSAKNVIAEVQFKESGGMERSIEELSDIHEFCYNIDDETRAKFDHECTVASNNYIETTKDYSELSPEMKDHISENLAVYDPETGEVSYEKTRSTWGMIGINSARAIASSVPAFMQYQQTKMSLPYMKNQALYQKTYQHWYNQQFTANFFRPGGFTSFGGSGGLNYGVPSLNEGFNPGNRVPIGNPQSLSIP